MTVSSNPNKRISRIEVPAGVTSAPMVIPAWAGLVRGVAGSGGTMAVESVDFPVEALIIVAQAADVPVDFSGNDIVRTDGGDWTADGFAIGQFIDARNAFAPGPPGTPRGWGPTPYEVSVNDLTGRAVTGVTASALTLDGPAFTAETDYELQVITGRVLNPDATFASLIAAAAGVSTAPLTPELTAVRGIAATADGLVELLEV